MTGQKLYESRQNHKGGTTPWADLRANWQVNWERNAQLKTEARERYLVRNTYRLAKLTGDPWVVAAS